MKRKVILIVFILLGLAIAGSGIFFGLTGEKTYKYNGLMRLSPMDIATLMQTNKLTSLTVIENVESITDEKIGTLEYTTSKKFLTMIAIESSYPIHFPIDLSSIETRGNNLTTDSISILFLGVMLGLFVGFLGPFITSLMQE